MRRSPFRHMLLGACLAAPFLLAGCTGGEGVPQSFPPLRYSYLAPISLNVAAIQTDVAYVPAQDGSSMDTESPEPPLQAVQQMIQDRLVAAGSNGTATITINSASLNRVDDTVVGNVSLQLSVRSADGHRTGYTVASVTRTRTLPDDMSDESVRAFLYSMTSDLVNAENVELEYQIRQHLAVWLVGGTSPVIGGPAAPTPVEAEPLSGPGAPAAGAPTPGAPVPLGAPMPLGAPTSASPAAGMPTAGMPAAAAPPMPSAMPAQPTNLDTGTTATMPGSPLGLPEGNPVPQDLTPAPTAPEPTAPALDTTEPGAPVPLTPPPGATPSPAYQLVPTAPPASTTAKPAPAPTPAAAIPKPAPSAPAAPASPKSSGPLPPLPPTITP